MFRELCYRIALLCAALWLASWAGMVHGLGDSLATFRPFWVLGVVLCGGFAGLAGRRGGGALVLLGLAAAGITAVTWGAHRSVTIAQDGPAPVLRLYQNNLLFRLDDPQPTLDSIAALSPDVITFQEVSPQNEPILETLRATYPHQVLCPYGPVGGTAVLSRLPVSAPPLPCRAGTGIAGLRVATQAGPVWVVSVHLPWPFPYDVPAQLASVEAGLAELDGDIVVAGDFNIVAGTHRLRRVARAAGAHRIGGWTPTFGFLRRYDGGYPFQIDHILSNRPGTTALAPRTRSDHHPLVAVIR